MTHFTFLQISFEKTGIKVRARSLALSACPTIEDEYPSRSWVWLLPLPTFPPYGCGMHVALHG